MLTHHQCIVDEFTDSIGLSRFDIASNTPHVLLFDQKWCVHIGEESGHLVLFAGAGCFPGTVPAPDCIETLPDALQWRVISGCDERFKQQLGWQRSSGLVIFHSCAQSGDLDSVSFGEWIHAFLNQLENWATLLTAQNQQTIDQQTLITAPGPKAIEIGTGFCLV